jgi:hypothetical protein
VIVEAGGKTMTRFVTGARGYLSQSEFPVTIGLGTTDKVNRVLVKWPGKDAGEEEFAGGGRISGWSQGRGRE